MTFFDPTSEMPAHRCRLPEPSPLQKQGWRCGCGKAWVKASVSQHGESWVEWRRSPSNDAPESVGGSA